MDGMKIMGSQTSKEVGMGGVQTTPDYECFWIAFTEKHSCSFQYSVIVGVPGEPIMATKRLLDFLLTSSTSPWAEREGRPAKLVYTPVAVPKDVKDKLEAMAKKQKELTQQAEADLVEFDMLQAGVQPPDDQYVYLPPGKPSRAWTKEQLIALARGVSPQYNPGDWQAFTVGSDTSSMARMLLAHLERHSIEALPRRVPRS